MPEAPTREPTTLRIAVWLLLGEAVALAVVLVFLVYEDLTGAAGTVRGAIAVTVYTALLAAVLGWLSWALHGRRGWARGPAIVLQLLLVLTGYTMTTNRLPEVGLPVLVIGLVGAGTLLAPATRAALGRN
jgi:hypothetical protein